MIARGTARLCLRIEPGETVRTAALLKKGGRVVVSARPVMPVTASLSGSVYDGKEMLDYLKKQVEHLQIVDTEKACEELGSAKVVNLLLLGRRQEAERWA